MQRTVSNHLEKMAELPHFLNTDLSKGFTVPQVAEKHGWTEPMVWSPALEGKDDLEAFKELGRVLQTNGAGNSGLYMISLLSHLGYSYPWKTVHDIKADKGRFSYILTVGQQQQTEGFP